MDQAVTATPQIALAHSLARESQNPPAEALDGAPSTSPLDPDLAKLVNAWPDLPEHMRRTILAMVDAVGR